MAQDGSTHDGPDRAPRSPWARSALPQSPWQPDAVGAIETPNDGLSVAGRPAGAAAQSDVIDLAPPDDGGFIDLGDHGRSSAIEVDPDGGARPETPRKSGRFDALASTLSSAVHGRRDPSRRPRTRPAADRPRAAIIDLGERHGNDAARLGSSPWRSVEWRAHVRPFALAIIVVAALLVGGSVAPPLGRLARLGSITVPLGAALATDGSRAVVLGSRDGVGESVASYEVAGGRRDWFTELSIRQADDIGMTITDGVVIVTAGALGNRGTHSVVLDERTGRRLWSTSLNVWSPWLGSDTVLMINDAQTNVMARDKRSGAVKWSYSLPTGCLTPVLAVPDADEVPTAMVVMCPDSSTLSRINLDTGQPDISSHVPLSAADTDTDVSMFTVSDVVVVEDAAVKPPRFETYGLGDLKPIWKTAGFSPNDKGYECGVEICVSAAGSTVILDTRTGAVIPTTAHDAELASRLSRPFVPASKVGTLLLPARGATVPVVSKTTYVADFYADERVVHLPLFRPGRTWIVTLSAGGVRDAVQLLVGPAADVCRPIGSYLGCMTAKNTLTFWTLPKIG
jgi:outer membrane protein assembly factor BamB